MLSQPFNLSNVEGFLSRVNSDNIDSPSCHFAKGSLCASVKLQSLMSGSIVGLLIPL